MEIVLTDGTVVPSVEIALEDGSVAREFTLPSGMAVVKVRSIPPMLIADVMAGDSELVEPQMPMVKVGGIGEKWLPARTGDPEYHEWMDRRREIEALREQKRGDYTWDYGIVEWKRPADASKFASTPPTGWKFPQFLKDHGRKPRTGKTGKRVDFIRYTLFQTTRDVEAAQIVMFQITNPITEEETDALADLFQGD